MYALVFLGLLACASAAPHYYGPPPPHYGPPPPHYEHGPPPPHHHQHHEYNPGFSMERFYDDSVFDTRQFWAELNKEMNEMHKMIEDLMTHFPRSTSNAGFKDDQYIITIALNGFTDKDIVVKAREGVIMVQAVRKNDDGSESSYIDVRNLPEGVSPAGQWNYEQGVLKIVLPLNKDRTTEANESTPTEAGVTEVATTAEPKDREEIESQEGQGSMDADVGLERGDSEILTNEVSRQNPAEAAEATTYAVDVRNDIDFVPVNYKLKS